MINGLYLGAGIMNLFAAALIFFSGIEPTNGFNKTLQFALGITNLFCMVWMFHLAFL